MRQTTFHRAGLVAVACAIALGSGIGAQLRAPQYRIEPLTDLTGAPGLSLALRKLTTVGTLMQTTAHPDDENNAVLALYARHVGARVALVSATRGDGGQNEIGPELFDALGILRTEELLAAHRFDGAEQYFTRAVDFGYSFSTEETLDKWGHREILGDFVRLIRTLRPDVVVSLGVDGTGGGQHHQASGLITAEAFKAAADPRQFPDQIAAGLRPWQARKLYRPVGGFGGRGQPGIGRGQGRGDGGRAGPGRGPAGRGAEGSQIPEAPGARPANGSTAPLTTIDTNRYEPLLGCTIGEIGGVAAGMHMCQGRAPLVPPPAATSSRYRLIESTLAGATDRAESSFFDGIDTSIVGLARYAGARQADNLIRGLAIISSHVASARAALDSGGPATTVPHLADGLAAVRGLREGLASVVESEDGRYEMDFRLALKEQQFQEALILAQSLRIDATADDGMVVAGQPVSLNVVVANRGPGEIPVSSIALAGLDAAMACAAGTTSLARPYTCAADARIPAAATLTGPYWQRPEDGGRAVFAPAAPFGVPFLPTPFKARLTLEIGGARVEHEVPIQFRYEGAALVGEKRMELKVVPAFSVSVTPKIAVLPRAAARAPDGTSSAASREIRVTVINGAKAGSRASVRLKLPSGWRATPDTAPIVFAREDEAVTARFVLTMLSTASASAPSSASTSSPPPPSGSASEAVLTAEVFAATSAGVESQAVFSTGYQAIEYPHIERRHTLVPAAAALKNLDVAVAPDLSVGYIVGVGDQVPPALQQLGATLTFIDSDELAWGDLSKYHTIVTGVRAYERRDDLRANNHRLLEFVAAGGTVIVQYNKAEFNRAQYGPFPAEVSSNRITDEQAAVTVLAPAHQVFSWPNRIDAAAWSGWVQERGLYFLGDRDARYVDLIEMTDPFANNAGPRRGALVEARHGKGRWLYVGLGLWRQLPAGTDGAYRLMANLVSLGKSPK